ncbi:hypothetical protein ACOME3_010119 [Neoechinorhynchus agilis]
MTFQAIINNATIGANTQLSGVISDVFINATTDFIGGFGVENVSNESLYQVPKCLNSSIIRNSACRFARFSQVMSIIFSIFLIVPQLVKLFRQRGAIASGISVCWLILTANACLADIPFQFYVRSTYGGFLVFSEMVLFGLSVTALTGVLILNSADLYFDDKYYRPIVAGASVATFGATVLFSLI